MRVREGGNEGRRDGWKNEEKEKKRNVDTVCTVTRSKKKGKKWH